MVIVFIVIVIIVIIVIIVFVFFILIIVIVEGVRETNYLQLLEIASWREFLSGSKIKARLEFFLDEEILRKAERTSRYGGI